MKSTPESTLNPPHQEREPARWQIAWTIVCALAGLFLALAGEPRGTPLPFPLLTTGQLIFTVYVISRMIRHRRARAKTNEWSVYNTLLVLFPILQFFALALAFELVRALF